MTQDSSKLTLPPTQENLQLAQFYLKQFLKKISIKVKGNVVTMTQYYELPDPTLAKAFAKNLAETFKRG